MKCGYIAVIGRSNAGKSSLINKLVGEEVAVVSHRKQTTRNNILGIVTDETCQMVFIDTPGVHHSKNKLDRFMMKNVRSAISTADVIVYLIDSTCAVDQEERDYIKMLKEQTENVIVAFNKIDKQKNVENGIADVLISVKSGEGLDRLKELIVEKLPEQEMIYSEDSYTDKSVKFLVCEHIRGILLDKFDNEIPHGVAVVAENLDETDRVVNIEISLICENERHKGVIIGKGGANLKEIGISARMYAESLFEKKVNIKIFVKVDEGWRDKNITKYGYTY